MSKITAIITLIYFDGQVLVELEARKLLAITEIPRSGEIINDELLIDRKIDSYDMSNPSNVKIHYETFVDSTTDFVNELSRLLDNKWQVSNPTKKL
jgi:hypothetical protein